MSYSDVEIVCLKDCDSIAELEPNNQAMKINGERYFLKFKDTQTQEHIYAPLHTIKDVDLEKAISYGAVEYGVRRNYKGSNIKKTLD